MNGSVKELWGARNRCLVEACSRRMRRGSAKDALEGLKWKDRIDDWSRVEVVIRHRGAPRDRKSIAGERITSLGASFFEVDGETQVPYHRILVVAYRGDVVYERAGSSENIS